MTYNGNMRITPVPSIVLACSMSLTANAQSCRETAGAQGAATYVAQCLMVSPATHPPCNMANPCVLIVEEIRRGCSILREAERQRPALRALPPDFCKTYLSD